MNDGLTTTGVVIALVIVFLVVLAQILARVLDLVHASAAM